jgi:hypothetical protein
MAEFAPPQVPQVPGTQPQQGASLSPTADAMEPLVQGDPLTDFINSLIRVFESKGLDLNEVMSGEPSVEESADLQDPNVDPLELLSMEELTMLTKKFMAIPEPQKSELVSQLREALPPHIAQRMEAVLRMVEGRETQVGVTR